MTGGNDDNETALARALVCYRLIAEAAAAPHGARTALLRLAASKEVAWPDGRAVSVTVRTLQRWLERFQRGGLRALVRAPRKDKGQVRAVPEAALARVITLRKEEPARSTPTLIDIVERADEVAQGALRRSTLDRHLDKRGASRRMLHVLGTKRHVKLAFPHPLDFVVGDFHQGPYYRDVHGEIRRAVLGAFIDHCSRFVPESRYGLVEDQMHVRRGLRALCTRVGPPHKLYVDGGPGYQGAGDVAELARLRKRKGIADWQPLSGFDDLLTPAPDADRQLFRDAETSAYEVRDRLDLEDAAVPSMIELFEKKLQVPIFWATPYEIDSNIDGASTREPIAAVLVNLVGGAERWWRTRMTLAHELCHLLFDSMPNAAQQHMVMFSPHRERDLRGTSSFQFYELPVPLERMEKRANAFASHFMAPGRAIRALVPRNDATSESAITLLCQHFGIGRVTAINQLSNVFSLSKQERARMIDRTSAESCRITIPTPTSHEASPRGVRFSIGG